MRLARVEKTGTGLALYKSGTAVQLRREIMENPEVMEKLQMNERFIIVASTKKAIGEVSEEEIFERFAVTLKAIAKDTGYKIPENVGEWGAECARIYVFIKSYYPWVTLSEIKVAFELLLIGELDQYLPNGKGGADRSHYQEFNVSYFAKVLTAYKQKRGVVVNRAAALLPAKEKGRTKEEIESINRDLKKELYANFEKYKAERVPFFSACQELYIYDILREYDLCQEIEINDKDKSKGLAEFLNIAAAGLVNSYTVKEARRDGGDSKHILGYASREAKKRVIVEAYEKIIEEKINLLNVLNI